MSFVETIKNLKPQLISGLLGGWLVLFGLSGVLTHESPRQVVQPVSSTPSRLRVVPANQLPGDVSAQLQGAGTIPRASGGLQNQNQSDLQPNSGLSSFPENSNQRVQ